MKLKFLEIFKEMIDAKTFIIGTEIFACENILLQSMEHIDTFYLVSSEDVGTVALDQDKIFL